MKKYLTAKQDLEKYSMTDLLTLSQYYDIPFKNRNDLCWILSLNILGYTVRGTMNGTEEEKWTALKAAVEDEPSETETEEESDIPESLEDLSLKEQCDLHNEEFELCNVNIVPQIKCKQNKAAKYLTKKYHEIGDPWWAADCNAEMSPKQLDEAINDLELVYKLRCEHSKDFCNSEIDIQHLAALRKIQRKLERCLKLKCQEAGVEISFPDHPAFADVRRQRIAKAKERRVEESIKKQEGQTFRASIHEYFQRRRIGKEIYGYIPVGKAWFATITLPTGELLSGSMKRTKKDAGEDAAKKAYEFIVSKS